MTRSEARLERIAREVSFRVWFRRQRMFETMTANELEAYAVSGIWVDRPEPAFGMSRFDSMDRANLIKLWEKSMGCFAGRDGTELEFYAMHGFWPEQNAFEQ